VDTNTLDWELYMASMAFAYNTIFHRTIKTSPFTLTYGMNQEQYNLMPEQSMEKIPVPNSIKECSAVMNNIDSWQENTRLKPLTSLENVGRIANCAFVVAI
jgi:hypothetical protein